MVALLLKCLIMLKEREQEGLMKYAAYLSDGEYVIDAETVSMLGDGSNKAGAEVLNDMRKSIRKHKGSNLVNGEFSDDAMSPLEYMRGN